MVNDTRIDILGGCCVKGKVEPRSSWERAVMIFLEYERQLVVFSGGAVVDALSVSEHTFKAQDTQGRIIETSGDRKITHTQREVAEYRDAISCSNW
eukprot:CAMPEP_0175986498 /NCGR_PEP_ID=MMETSP0108-20121206/50181_1 /TAXON_ID=195067 ORGANISM="Goniomonas pacifica, Strain CCMP1869" /NCGR_SAMPLE_ID=MMETSP0108 /ASSEMBLY_ACC=CAM_ASM_000204 /LENGTH=95 /DNA_ID=CAMNT_0017317659 /DNA_START=270 /DNA_END=554 /DNA_ORIENTATION=+